MVGSESIIPLRSGIAAAKIGSAIHSIAVDGIAGWIVGWIESPPSRNAVSTLRAIRVLRTDGRVLRSAAYDGTSAAAKARELRGTLALATREGIGAWSTIRKLTALARCLKWHTALNVASQFEIASIRLNEIVVVHPAASEVIRVYAGDTVTAVEIAGVAIDVRDVGVVDDSGIVHDRRIAISAAVPGTIRLVRS